MAKKEKIVQKINQEGGVGSRRERGEGEEGGDYDENLIMKWHDPASFERSKEKKFHEKILEKMASKVSFICYLLCFYFYFSFFIFFLYCF